MNELPPDLTHDNLAESFDEVMNQYDLNRRLEVLIDQYLSSVIQKGSLVLDAGCGTGFASLRLSQLSDRVVSIDIGGKLVRLTRNRANSIPSQASILQLPFPEGNFDVVFSSEVIEHTQDPLEAVCEIWRVIKPGGYLALSTPNYIWQWPVRFASILGIRPYDGYENFLPPRLLRKTILRLGGAVLDHRGIHLLPFQFGFLNRINLIADRFGKILLPIMINQSILAIKPK